MPRAVKKAAPLGAPDVATGSVASRDNDDQQRSRSGSRSGFEEEWDRMEVDQAGGSGGHRPHKSRRSRRLKKSTQRRTLPSTSSDERAVDQAAGSQGSGVSRCSRPTCWDVKPLIPIPPIQPRRDVMKELMHGGSTTRLTSRRPHMDATQE